MPRKRKQRKPEADPQIGELVGNIIKYKKFKQMAAFNMSCLLQKITPPASEWEENVKEMVKQNGIETIVEVLKQNPGHAEVLAIATKTLAKLAYNAEISTTIATQGGIGVALASLAALEGDMDDELQREALEKTVGLLESVAACAPEALVQAGSVANVVAVMTKYKSNPEAVAACSRTLERISRTETGLSEIVQQNGVPVILGMFTTDSLDEQCFTPAFKFMKRVCQTEQYSKYVNECGGVETMVQMLDQHQDNPMLLKHGGRLLSKMARHQLSETMAKLQNPDLPEATKLMTLNLLSNLATEDECSEKIVLEGGINTLIADLGRDDKSPAIVESNVKFLGRLMTSNKNVKEMIAGGGVDTILKVISNNDGNAEIMNAAVPTLVKMCSAAEDITSIVDANNTSGLVTIIATITNHPEYTQSTEAGMGLLAKMAASQKKDNKAELIQAGAIVAATKAMAANPDSELTQANGIKLMSALAGEPSYGQYIVDTGVIQQVISGLQQFEDNHDFVQDSFSLLSKLCQEGNNGRVATIAALKTEEGLEAVTSAIANYGSDPKIKMLVAGVLGHIAEKSDVDAALAQLKKIGAGNDLASNEVRATLEKLNAYALAPESSKWVMDSGGLDEIIKMLKIAAMDKDISGQEGIISSCTAAINELLQNPATRDQVLAKLKDKKLLKSLLTAMKINPKCNPTSSMRLMQTLASEKSIQSLLVENGGTETIVAMIRGNADDLQAVMDGIQVLQRMANSPEGIEKITRKGAVRLISKLLENSANDKAFEPTVAPMLRLLSSITSNPAAKQLAIKQGVKDAIVTLMNNNLNNESVQNLGGNILVDCVASEDIVECARFLAEQAQLKGEVNKGALQSNLNLIASFAQGGNNAKAFIDLGVAQTLVVILADAVSWEDEEERLLAVNAISKALGSIASKEALDDSMQAVPWLLHALKITESATVLQAVTAVATTDANVASLIAGGGVETIIALVQKHSNDQAISAAGFQAMARMAASGETAVDKITQSGGLMICKDFLENGVETATPEQQLEAMTLMSHLVSQEASATYINHSGGIEVMFDLIDQEMAKEEPNAKTIQAGLNMLATAARTPAVAASIAHKGDMRNLIQSIEKAKLGKDKDSLEIMKTFAKFLETEIQFAPESVEVMATYDVADLMMETMSLHGQDADLTRMGAIILQSVVTADQASSMVMNNIEQMEGMLTALAASPGNTMLLTSLEAQMQSMSSMMMVEGALTSDNVASIMSMIDTVDLAASKTASSQTTELMACCTDTIGRLDKLNLVSSEQIASAVMRAAAASNGDENVMTAAITLMDNASVDSASVQSMEDSGCIKVLGTALKESAADPKLNAAAKASVAKLSQMVINDDGTMMTATMASILDAQSNDSQQLTSVLDLMAETNSSALLSCMETAPSDSMRVEVQAVKSIAKSATEGNLSVSGITASQMGGIVKNMRRAQQAKEAEAKAGRATGMAPSKDGVGSVASQLVDTSMGLMAIMADDENQATNMADQGGIEELVAVLDSTESTSKQKKLAAKVLTNVAKHNNLGLSAKMVQLQVSAKIAAALRDMEDEDFANDALMLLQSITSTCGAEECGLDEDSLKIISVAVENQADGSGGATKGKELLETMASVFKDAAEGASTIDGKMQKAAQALATIADIEEVQDENGKTYYVNRATNETSWEAPAGYKAVCEKFQKVADLGDTHAANMVEVDVDTVAHTVAALEQLSTKPALATSVTDALSRLATNEKNATVIAQNGGIKAVIECMRANPTITQLLINCIRLLNQFAKHDHYKKIVAAEGGIPLILHCLNTQAEEQILVKLCLSCLANLAFNSSANLDTIVELGGIKATESIMQLYKDDGPVLELCMVALSNLMHENDGVRITVGQTCGDEIVNTIRRLTEDASLCKSAMRAIGNLSFCDQNIHFIVNEHATEVVVKAMDHHPEDIELLQLGIDVIGNLASLDFDEDADDEEMDRQEKVHDEVYELIFNEGGPSAILDILKNRKETSLLLSGMDALSNIANDDISVAKLLKKGLVEQVLDSMAANDWDEELSECTVKLLASISVGEECTKAIADQNGVQLLLSAMESHEDEPEFLAAAHIALSNVVAIEEARKTVLDLKGIPTIVKQLKDFPKEAELTEKVIETLIRLSADDLCSEAMSEEGMFMFCGLIDQWSDHVRLDEDGEEDDEEPSMLETILALLGHLAFVTSNLRKLVQFDGVKKIVACIKKHSEDIDVMIKAVQVSLLSLLVLVLSTL